jgi:hypothetical protein
MKTSKPFALAALLVLGATLVASTPARAQLELMPTGAEPGATGQATLSHIKYAGSGIVNPLSGLCYEAYKCTLSVTCQGLTPGATYTGAANFTASRKGKGSSTIQHYGFLFYYYVQDGTLYGWPLPVYRVNADGSQTLVLLAVVPPSFW